MKCAPGKLSALFLTSLLLGCTPMATTSRSPSNTYSDPPPVRPTRPSSAAKPPATSMVKKDPENLPEKLTDTASQERALLAFINEARAKENAPALKLNPALADVAHAHAAEMAGKKKMDVNLDGKPLPQHIEFQGYSILNFAMSVGSSSTASARTMVEVWLKDPATRGNLLNKSFEDIGIGIAGAAGGPYYFTQILAVAKKP